MACAPANLVAKEALEFIHPAFIDTNGNQISVRALNDTQDRAITLEATAPLNAGQSVIFSAIPFVFGWPGQAEGQASSLTIRIDNIGREMMPYLDAAAVTQDPLICVVRLVTINTDTGTVTYGGVAYQLYIRDVTVTEDALEGQASGADLANLQTMRLPYDLETYPSLSYVAS
ncbi:hypothetical protein M2322_000852 [Rhodoblastus acidophilus]|uniref:DUF1833 domain-containing protein n=1 Tax=Rhodoblastus acidophilus TaxID=1074 RepID=UPI0022240FE9|nr:DUF1833 domain-containing protein [Rhodoblastus acidophilus]MCW2315318.1 hypothetical protein [Rhodoblastus acidophilus]